MDYTELRQFALQKRWGQAAYDAHQPAFEMHR